MIPSRLRQTRPYALLRDARYLWRHRARRAFYGSFVTRGSLVFDVGANAAHYTLIFRSLGARVIAVHGKPDFCKIDVEGFEHQVLAGLDVPIRALPFEFNREYLDVADPARRARIRAAGQRRALAHHSISRTVETIALRLGLA